MREFRTGYFAAPRQTDRFSEPGYVQCRVNVTMPPCSAFAGETMSLPFTDGPARRARLTRVCGVNKNHAQSSGFSLVGNKVLQLPESPAMQSRPDSLPCLDVGADISQVFHADFACTGTQRFRNNGFAGFMVDVLDMPLLAPGDSLEFALGSAATVGLETTAMGKVNVPVVPELSAAPDLASAGRCEVVFAHVDTNNAVTSLMMQKT